MYSLGWAGDINKSRLLSPQGPQQTSNYVKKLYESTVHSIAWIFSPPYSPWQSMCTLPSHFPAIAIPLPLYRKTYTIGGGMDLHQRQQRLKGYDNVRKARRINKL